MADRFTISDDQLSSAGTFLVAAAHVARAQSTGVPTVEFESLSGIGDDVRAFVQGMRTGMLALADAGRTATDQISMLMRDASALDAQVASALGTGFALSGGAR
ncbi:hypothetical protein [Leucobacter japonicus]|uniref:hypothetical protein n=1 Tax=Leucobacter japonicus TaxID=1461259 RepID=UPI0006A7C043|nr:hypothetical protein [Leucobacter japonicus]